MSYSIVVYGVHILDNDPDYYKAETEAEAIAVARSKVKAGRWDTAHAVVTAYGGLVATVVRRNGRVQTKKARK